MRRSRTYLSRCPGMIQSLINQGYQLADSLLSVYLRGKGCQPAEAILNREETRKLKVNNLDLTNYPNLEKVTIDSKYVNGYSCYLKTPLTNLILPENSLLKEIDCSRNNLTNLVINQQPYLTYLACEGNENLTNLTVTNNPSLTELYCSNCQLTNTNFILANNPQLTILNCSNNQLTNLNFFTQLTSLKKLLLRDNPLTGSLASLQNCQQLNYLSISNTNLNSGLEYLPKSLERLECDGELAKQLKGYEKEKYVQEIMELENSLNNLSLALVNSHVQNQTINQGLAIFIFETEEKIKELSKQNQEYYEAKIEQLPYPSTKCQY
ncbi:1908_t:CDS:2 [Scutellospora calospora]|uniref:1908_t:CDS:1 n=1 Tax=Scutellospora calospora TaxID=85575 RepID=A0ACA9KHE2_9GLOM|nr:1908_t:CDS:2 [Scutellospora calospora]